MGLRLSIDSPGPQASAYVQSPRTHYENIPSDQRPIPRNSNTNGTSFSAPSRRNQQACSSSRREAQDNGTDAISNLSGSHQPSSINSLIQDLEQGTVTSDTADLLQILKFYRNRTRTPDAHNPGSSYSRSRSVAGQWSLAETLAAAATASSLDSSCRQDKTRGNRSRQSGSSRSTFAIYGGGMHHASWRRHSEEMASTEGDLTSNGEDYVNVATGSSPEDQSTSRHAELLQNHIDLRRGLMLLDGRVSSRFFLSKYPSSQSYFTIYLLLH
ncbi:unnamed protein product [Protopolystoma xenopodis]|uniref:Uncharacterized protein n=1 Tax=Protopolystoma xenopodis TaxID=117903 RepID=A0A3S4ZRB5_9PLAT|nr:unnamed protein product [Protopolystoma xenopodis]